VDYDKISLLFLDIGFGTILCMQKDFEKWSSEKEHIHVHGQAPFYHEREVWWCALGTNIGFEQDGTGKNYDRPVVILRGFNKNVFFGVALTGRKREGSFYLHLGEIQDRDASAVLSQVRLCDSRRLVRKIATLDEITFRKLQEAVKRTLFP
jgi:mRNA interferase MazF